LPKRGFTNISRKEFAIVNLEDLNRFAAGSEVSPETLFETGIVKNPRDGIKILGDGDLTVALTVKANKFSKSALEKIQAAGGKTEVI
jgi:large subunit ribosomal protein L15